MKSLIKLQNGNTSRESKLKSWESHEKDFLQGRCRIIHGSRFSLLDRFTDISLEAKKTPSDPAITDLFRESQELQKKNYAPNSIIKEKENI